MSQSRRIRRAAASTKQKRIQETRQQVARELGPQVARANRLAYVDGYNAAMKKANLIWLAGTGFGFFVGGALYLWVG